MASITSGHRDLRRSAGASCLSPFASKESGILLLTMWASLIWETRTRRGHSFFQFPQEFRLVSRGQQNDERDGGKSLQGAGDRRAQVGVSPLTKTGVRRLPCLSASWDKSIMSTAMRTSVSFSSCVLPVMPDGRAVVVVGADLDGFSRAPPPFQRCFSLPNPSGGQAV